MGLALVYKLGWGDPQGPPVCLSTLRRILVLIHPLHTLALCPHLTASYESELLITRAVDAGLSEESTMTPEGEKVPAIDIKAVVRAVLAEMKSVSTDVEKKDF